MRRGIGGLPVGIGIANADTSNGIGTERGVQTRDTDAIARMRATATPATDSATPIQMAAITAFASVSLPSRPV